MLPNNHPNVPHRPSQIECSGTTRASTRSFFPPSNDVKGSLTSVLLSLSWRWVVSQLPGPCLPSSPRVPLRMCVQAPFAELDLLHHNRPVPNHRGHDCAADACEDTIAPSFAREPKADFEGQQGRLGTRLPQNWRPYACGTAQIRDTSAEVGSGISARPPSPGVEPLPPRSTRGAPEPTQS